MVFPFPLAVFDSSYLWFYWHKMKTPLTFFFFIEDFPISFFVEFYVPTLQLGFSIQIPSEL